ncbi:MAG TPA: magnesium/cobalt transporter CorA [Candidatus Limnocylindria bacterium]
MSNRLALVLTADGELVTLDEASYDDIDGLISRDGNLVWLDVGDPTAEDIELLKREFDLHDLAIEDLRKRRQRPKVDTYPGHHVVIAYEPLPPGDPMREFDLGELHLFAGRGFLVSVHWGGSPVVESVQERFRHRAAAVAANAGWLLYAVLDTAVDGYFPLLDRISEDIDALEDRILEGRGNTALLREILNLKRQLLELRRVLGPMRDVANTLLRRDVEILDDEALPYYQDLYDHLVRVLDSLDLYRDLVAATLDAHETVTTNNLNQIVKRLTAVTVLLMVPTLIAGIYGMNFFFMPELQLQYGYPAVLLAMLLIVIGLAWYMRRRGWF